MTTDQVYVALLNEGVQVFRPVQAVKVAVDVYVLLRPDDFDPDDESWEFPPGSTVFCESRKIRDGDLLTAVRRVAFPNRKTA